MLQKLELIGVVFFATFNCHRDEDAENVVGILILKLELYDQFDLHKIKQFNYEPLHE